MVYEEETNITITETSKIKSKSVEYNIPNEISPDTNVFRDLAVEYEAEPFRGKFNEQTQFKSISIETPAPDAYGEVLSVSNIRMFSKPLTGNQKAIEDNS